MFCIYKTANRQTVQWVAELRENVGVKLTAYGNTPTIALEKLFEMIASDDDETGTYAETDGALPLLPSGRDNGADGAQ